MRLIYRVDDPRPPRRLTCIPRWIGINWFNRAPGRKLM